MILEIVLSDERNFMEFRVATVREPLGEMTIKWKEATRRDPCGSLRNMNSGKQQEALENLGRGMTFLNEYLRVIAHGGA
jgi:hypothetical protein